MSILPYLCMLFGTKLNNSDTPITERSSNSDTPITERCNCLFRKQYIVSDISFSYNLLIPNLHCWHSMSNN